MSVSDARILAGVPDMAFLVAVRLLLTDKRQLKMTMEALRTVNARIIGTIMNYADVTSSSSYGYGMATNIMPTAMGIRPFPKVRKPLGGKD